MTNRTRAVNAIAAGAMMLFLSAGTTPVAAQSTTSSSTHKAQSSTTHHKTPLVDVNSATKEQLMALPGMTDEQATKIISGRPYKAKADLETKGILPKAEYNRIASHITARAPKA